MPDDYLRLIEDLNTNGYDESQPIYIYEGHILDGWNRYRACDELAINPVTKDFIGSDMEAIEFVMRTNKRRNLTSSQWAAIAVDAEELVATLREATEKARREKISEQQTVNNSKSKEFQTTQLIGESEKHETETAQKLATTFNTNRTYISEAERLKENNPDLFEQVKRGEKTITEIKKEEKIQKRTEEIERQKEDIRNGNIELPEGKFEIIVVDPPWNYGREYDPDGSRVANPYPEMSQEELKQLEMPSADNSIIWLWTTHAFIWDAKELLNHWGFDYKAILVWDKENMGMGAWLRMQTEFCLLGIKGKPIWDIHNVRDIIREQRREHSRKPDSFYKMIDDNFVGRRLDYFSRQQRFGWELMGNDIKKFADG